MRVSPASKAILLKLPQKPKAILASCSCTYESAANIAHRLKKLCCLLRKLVFLSSLISSLMATERILKPFKWFSNKSLMRRSFHGRRSRSSSSGSPMSPCSIREGELSEVFCHFDGDGDGKISAYELRSYFGSIGDHLSHEEAQGVINDLDSDGDNLLDLQDFTRLMNREDEDDEDLRKAFEMFVWEEGSGCITPKGLQRMMHRLGHDKSYDECVAMIDAFDVDHNGVLDFNEFHQMMA